MITKNGNRQPGPGSKRGRFPYETVQPTAATRPARASFSEVFKPFSEVILRFQKSLSGSKSEVIEDIEVFCMLLLMRARGDKNPLVGMAQKNLKNLTFSKNLTKTMGAA